MESIVTPDGNVFFPVALSHLFSGESNTACENVYGGDPDATEKARPPRSYGPDSPGPKDSAELNFDEPIRERLAELASDLVDAFPARLELRLTLVAEQPVLVRGNLEGVQPHLDFRAVLDRLRAARGSTDVALSIVVRRARLE